MVHSVVTFVAPVHPAVVEHVRALLNRPDGHERPLPLRVDPQTLPMLHFASMVVFDGQPLSPAVTSMGYLVLECCVDGSSDDFLDELAHLDGVQGGPLAKVFSHCHDWATSADLRSYLDSHIRRPNLLHIGTPSMRRWHIQAGQKLRARLDAELDARVANGRSLDDPLQLVEELLSAVEVPVSKSTDLHYSGDGWIADPVSRSLSRIKYWSLLLLAFLALAGIVLGPPIVIWSAFGARAGLIAVAAIILLVGLAWRWLVGHNRTPITVRPKHLDELKTREDHFVQNHMCTFTLIQNTFARRTAARLVLATFERVYRTWFTDVTPGRLSGLPTIHFAHWTIVPVQDAAGADTGREALMFLSNYDGSWDAYLDDFIAFLLQGVAAIWSCCEGFRWPLNAATFKAYARNGMTAWQCWYRGQPDLTILNILNNDQIRLGLLRPPATDEEARLWLARFGSLKEGFEAIEDDAGALQESDVQGVVLSGYRKLPESAHVLLRITDPAATLRWLRRLLPSVTHAGEQSDAQQSARATAVNIAFTWQGMAALGLPAVVGEQFSLPFQEGMAPASNPHRSRALGDVGASDPSEWTWGDRRRLQGCPDILLMLYARDKVQLSALVDAVVTPFAAGCGQVLETVTGRFLPSNGHGPLQKLPAEHFGFVDGISQPEIAGTWRARRRRSADVVKAGEFVLGYPAEDGTTTPGIRVPERYDRQHLLPSEAHDRHGARDFGRNGSYLVARQLLQDVPGFQAFISSPQSMPPGGVAHAPEQVAARLMGRFRDGRPLIDVATADDANDFAYAGDPHGFQCPVGAHIRRANPRDSLDADPALALRNSRRRRLLRRGRTYDEVQGNGSMSHRESGLMFLCLNSDIERQFEFVQQNWINGSAFGGVYDERDPVIGVAAANGHYTMQGNAVRQRVSIDQYVTVQGGDYFFLPGLSALRYLANLAPSPQLSGAAGRVTVAQPVAAFELPPVTVAPWLARAIAALPRLLLRLQLAWAIRVPLLLAIALVALWWLGATSVPVSGRTFFLGDRWGVMVVAWLASMTASAVMVTARLVLMYGERVGLPRPYWQAPARWAHVFAFQLLALPAAIACIHWNALDAAGVPGAGGYWRNAAMFVFPAVAGVALGVFMLALATTIQAIRPGARPDLMFPANMFMARAGARGGGTRTPGRLSRLLWRLSRWVVTYVPEALGDGYIDYHARRLLPGHAFALALFLIVLGVYGAGYFLLRPDLRWSLPIVVPPVGYLLFLMILVGWPLAAASFFLDRYRLSTVVTLVVWVALVAAVGHTDHFFPVKGRIEPAPTAAEALTVAQNHHATPTVVLVMAEGLGLSSSAWTARVLSELATDPHTGVSFTDSLRLVSSSSGASVGSMYFVNGYTKDGFNRNLLSTIRRDAAANSSSEGGWGVVYPEVMRTIAPVLVPRFLDRGWAMEQVWRRPFTDVVPTLSAWRRDVRQGWRPSTAFGVTAIETGEHSLFATFQTGVRDVTGGHDVSLVTAARLSATFPFVSPPARLWAEDSAANGQPPAYHLIDSGVSDNSGWTGTRLWLEGASNVLAGMSPNVLLVEIQSLPGVQPNGAAENAWTLELTGPLRALLEARNAQRSRVQRDIALFAENWRRTHPAIQHITFSLNDPEMPLTWNLGRSDMERINAAWRRNAASATAVCAALGGRSCGVE